MELSGHLIQYRNVVGQVKGPGTELHPKVAWLFPHLRLVNLEAVLPKEALELLAREARRRMELHAVNEVADGLEPQEGLRDLALQASRHDIFPGLQ